MKTVDVIDAVGMVLAHDMTQIIPGEYKGAKFKKGHVIEEKDIPIMLSMGKKHIYVVEKNDTDVHEDKAAMRIGKASSGKGIKLKGPAEGKVEFIAEYDGLLKINTQILEELVEDDEVVFATIHENQLVKAGQALAGARVVPLYVDEKVVDRAEHLCKQGTLIQVLPLKPFKVGLVTTGSEVYNGTIEDKFGPVLREKFTALGSRVIKQIFADDDENMILEAIKALIDEGVEIIGVTGGMSVDPDDRTPTGIRVAGGELVTYGAPVMPGAMFLLAYIGDIPVVGLPGCVMYNGVTIFDLIVPRILAGEVPTKKEIKKLAHGGFCQNCQVCTYPNCGYGKTY